MSDVLLPTAQDSPPSMTDPAILHHHVTAPKDLYAFTPASSSRSEAHNPAAFAVLPSSPTSAAAITPSASASLSHALREGDKRSFSSSGSLSVSPSGGKAEDRDEKVYNYMFLQLPVRLIYGQRPTPATVQTYWFSVDRQW